MIYDYKVKTAKGGELDLSEYKGKVIMIVNTATGCGFTPQYAPIEQMYKDYHEQGLEILDIPCNQFGGQAPGSDDEIHEFCTLHYNTTFPQMKKADVNGENELPLYTYLKAQKGFEGFGEHKLSALLADKLGGDGFMTDLFELEKLRPLIDDALAKQFIEVKREKKRQLAELIRAASSGLPYSLPASADLAESEADDADNYLDDIDDEKEEIEG